MWRERSWLLDALAASVDVGEFTDSMDLEAFVADKRTRFAVQYCFIIVAETVRQLRVHAPELGRRTPELQRIVDFRNNLAHQYDRTDAELLWQYVHNHLPSLRFTLESLLTEVEADWPLSASVNDPRRLQNLADAFEAAENRLAAAQAQDSETGRAKRVREARRTLASRILDGLSERRVRATYTAVGGVLGVLPISVSTFLGERRPKGSWVVSAGTKHPTGYTQEQMHADVWYKRGMLISTCDELRRVLTRR